MSIKSSFPTDSPSLVLDFANSRRLDPRITFTRAATGNVASYMGSDGLVKYAGPNAPRFDHRYVARTNLITYSEDYSNNSYLSSATVTTNTQISPDGSQTGDTLTSTANGGPNICHVDKNFVSLLNTTYTYSVFLKPGTSPKSTINLYYTGGTFRQAVLEITWGSGPSTFLFSTSGTTATSSIVPYPNGWYRVSLSYNSGDNTGGVSRIYVRDQNSDNVIGHTVHMWGHQVELADAPTAYIPTTSAPATESYIESLGLLIEESRTNLAPYSEDFNQWTKDNLNTTSWLNQEVSPDGSQTADKMIPDTTNSLHRVRITTPTINQDQIVTGSIFAKYGGTRYLNCGFGGSDNWENISSFPTLILDLVEGELTYNNFDMSPTLTEYPNGWYKLSFTAKKLTTSTTTLSFAASVNSTGTATHTGDGTSGIYLWGAQLEVGSFLTSYIPTSGGAVTRNVDKAEITGDNFLSFYNQSEGTFFADFVGQTIRPSISYDRYISFVGADPNDDEMGFFTQTASGGGAQNKIQVTLTISGVSTAVPGVLSGGGPDFGGKAIFAYKQDDGAFTIDNFAINKYSDLDVFTSMIALRIFGRARYQPEPSGHISKFVYYPLRLSNAQLQTLTN